LTSTRMESLVILPVVFLTRGIDFTDETNLLAARVAFALSQILALVAWILVAHALKARSTSSELLKRVLVPRAAASAFAPATDAAPDGDEDITVLEHDERELAKMRNQFLTRAGIILAIHWYWGAAVPLVIQIVSTPLSLWKEPLVRAYLRGETL